MENNKKTLKFSLNPSDLKIKSVLNQDFLVVEIHAISTAYPNRNKSHFTLESMQKAIEAKSFTNKPVLGYFDLKKPSGGDFDGHNADLKYDNEYDQLYFDYTDGISETPLGMIRSEDEVRIIHDDKDGLDWIAFTCALWVKYSYKQCKRLLKSRKKNISVEIEVNDCYIDEKGIEVITDFTFDGVTILGDDVEPAMPNSGLTIIEKLGDAVFQKKQKCLAFAYKNLDANDNEEVFSQSSSAKAAPEAAIVAEGAAKAGADINIYSSETPVINEGVEEVEMSTEEGSEGLSMTYEQKRSVLEAYLNEKMRSQNDEEHCCYVWVADVSEELVYFDMGDNFYSAPYVITEVAEGEEIRHEVTVDLENKKQVIRSWQEFAENYATSDDDAEGKTEDGEAEENKETECRNFVNQEIVAEEVKPEEFADGEPTEDKPTEDKPTEDTKETECGKFECGEGGEIAKEEESVTKTIDTPLEAEKEKIPEDKMGVTENIEAKEVECGKFATLTENVESVLEQGGVENTVVVDYDGKDSIPDSEPPVADAAELYAEKTVKVGEDELNIDQLFEKFSSVSAALIETNKTYESLEGEYKALQEKFDALNESYNALNENVIKEKQSKLDTFAANFVNSEDELASEERQNIYSVIKEKIYAAELTSEEEVKKFAINMLAVAVYEKKLNSKNDSKNFSFHIEREETIVKVSDVDKLNNLKNKLENI